MRTGVLAILSGVLWLLYRPSLPHVLWSLLPLCLAVSLLRARSAPARLVALFLVGLCWAWWRAAFVLATALPVEIEGRTVLVTGIVSELPEHRGRRVRFILETERLELGRRTLPAPARIRLDWSQPRADLHPGDRWQLAVRLKQPHGRANPGGFDQERWLFLAGVRATGYVVSGRFNRRITVAAGAVLNRLRASLRTRIEQAIGGRPGAGIVTALAIGAEDGITPAQWQVFRRTGTTHLVSVSGLHIGLVALLAFALGRWAWSLTGLALSGIAAQRVGIVSALLAALVYSALAGFAVPTVRTLVMLTIALTCALFLRRPPLSQVFAAALLAVVILNPLEVLGLGLWLSFGAVAALLYVCAGRRGRAGLFDRWCYVHIAMAIAMTPMLLWFFSQNPLVGPLANLIAIPWVSYVVTPAALAGTLLSPLWPQAADVLLLFALRAFDLIWPLLEFLAGLPAGQWSGAVPGVWALAATQVGIAIVLMPRGLPGRWIGGIWLLPLVWHPLERPAPGAYQFTLLDVGQGLAAVVETHTHVLVFDTGPRYGDAYDAGAAVVAPYLQQRGWHDIDVVILSHGDSDHTGGWGSLQATFDVHLVLSSTVPEPAPRVLAPCHGEPSWNWDGIRFQIVQASLAAAGDNDSSCVLRVGHGASALLVSGDIEARAEAALLAASPQGWGATVLVVPHHGSRTSSSEAFVRAVHPRHALVANGYRNRFGFPHAEVVARYRAAGAQVIETARSGAIVIRAGADGVAMPQLERERAPRLWQSR